MTTRSRIGSNIFYSAWMICLLIISGQSIAQVGPLLWEENFDSLNTELWTIDEGNGCEIGLCGWGNQELEYYHSDNVTIESVPGEAGNNALVFEARRENRSDSFGNNFEFTSGKINSENGVTVHYGMVETRIRVPDLQDGLWPAFWMLGTSTASWPSKGELDIMEMGHSDSSIVSHGHAGTPQNNFVGANAIFYTEAACVVGNETCAASTAYLTDNAYVSSEPMNDRFIIYRMYWTDTEIRFTAEDQGVEYDMYDSPIPITEESSELAQPFYFLMNMAIGGTFTGLMTPGEISAPMPSKMYIDYIRVYEYDGLGEVTLGNFSTPEYGTFGVFTDTSFTNNELQAGATSDIYVWNTASVTEGSEAPLEGEEVISWSYNAPGQWFGGGIQARQALDLSTFLEEGELTFSIKVPADISFRIGITDTYTNQNWVVFPANETVYGYERNGEWGQVRIPVSDLQGGLIALQSIEYPFAIVSLDGAIPTSNFELAIDDVLWEGGGDAPAGGDETFVANTVTFVQNSSDSWTSVEFAEAFASPPIVVMGDPSYNGSDPSTYRIRNITATGFEFQLDEWDYRDGAHIAEQATYIAITAGMHDLGGIQVVAGETTLNTSWQSVGFATAFDSEPVVFARQVSNNDSAATTTRIRNVSTTGFDIRLQEEEDADDVHANETVHYVAFELGNGSVDDLSFSVGKTENSVTASWFDVAFPIETNNPQVLVGMQTTDGGDTANTRYRNLSSTGVQVQIDEEQSRDNEVGHTTEVVAWVVFGDQQVVVETPVEVSVEAEDYARYSDTTAGNAGGEYRSDDVDIEITADASGAYNVGYVVSGEWLEYDVQLIAGDYQLITRVASAPGAGAYSISLDGEVVGSSNVETTGGWQNWIDQTIALVNIPSTGIYTIRIDMQASGFNINYFTFIPQTSAPRESLRTQAEDYEFYSDTSLDNEGGEYRNDDVDIQATADADGGYNIGWTEASEWLEYSVSLLPGTYDVYTRVASAPGGGAYSMSVNGAALNDVAVDSTGGWQIWEDQYAGAITISESGDYTLRIDISAGGFNVNYFDLVPVATSPTAPIAPTDYSGGGTGGGTEGGGEGGGSGGTGSDDTDGDGVFDEFDFCPMTLSGTTVDSSGCPANVQGTPVSLFDASTSLEPAIQFDRGDALVTRIADRARDRHAREDEFQAYDHYLTFYWENRTATIEIVDYVAKGGDTIEMTMVTQFPLESFDNRWLYYGVNTVAEYYNNAGMTQIGPTTYFKSSNYNSREGAPFQIGDKLEFEASQFLQLATLPRGRDNYYGTTYLYIVGEGLVPWDTTDTGFVMGGPLHQEDSFEIPESARMGGETTLPYNFTNEPDNHYMQMATNLSAENGQTFVLGRRVHHSSFVTGLHDENPDNGIFEDTVGLSGNNYINDSCAGCHVRNGRAEVVGVGESLDKWVFNIGTAFGEPDPLRGSVLQPQTTNSGAGEGDVTLAEWTEDGTGLRSPNYVFSGDTPDAFSARLAPSIYGVGLLEAVPESEILALEDASDADGDGISGRASRIIDPETGEVRLGRFGYKAGAFSIKHQVAKALNNDMGVMSEMLPNPDCGSAQSDCGTSGSEISNENMTNLVKYLALLGVRPQRDYDDSSVINGQQIFSQVGCDSCHTPTLQTSQFAEYGEVRSQTIHAYTDLLLHDMGEGLADNLGEGNATGSEWRTAPLWGIGLSACVTGGVINPEGGQGNEICAPDASYLHDGRARTIDEAIRWHGGEGQAANDAYQALNEQNKQDLVDFVLSL